MHDFRQKAGRSRELTTTTRRRWHNSRDKKVVRLDEQILKMRQDFGEEIQNLAVQVNSGAKWSRNVDRALEIQMTKAMRRHICGKIQNVLASLKDDKGQRIVEFDGAVTGELREQRRNGEIRTRKVLVLVESKNNLRDQDVNLDRCNTDEETWNCLPNRAQRYKDIYDGNLLEQWVQKATGKTQETLQAQLQIFKQLKMDNTELVFAIGGRYFPESLIGSLKKRGFLCLIPSGTDFEVI